MVQNHYGRSRQKVIVIEQMYKYQLVRQTILPVRIDEAWAFFSNPANLAIITPPEMDFRVVSKDLPLQIYNGLKISYTVRPLANIPLAWLSEISSVNAPHMFVDEQLKGPYAYWHHEHTFEEQGGVTLMKDIVTYALPLGVIGRMVNRAVVAKKLAHIFDYRAAKIKDLFKEI
jgi:ligand-binding SRPBCC domain-containing protein